MDIPRYDQKAIIDALIKDKEHGGKIQSALRNDYVQFLFSPMFYTDKDVPFMNHIRRTVSWSKFSEPSAVYKDYLSIDFYAFFNGEQFIDKIEILEVNDRRPI